MRWKGHVARMRDITNAYKILVESEGKIPLGRPRRRCDDKIKIYLRETGSEGVV
jgi:hypothetical protein